MSKIDPFVRILTFIIENSFPRCMNVEVQLPPGCAFWMFLCSISFAFTSLRADISVLLPNACVREIFGDSCSICESRTHMTSRERWLGCILGWFRWKSLISRFQFRGSARHCDCTACLRLILADICVICWWKTRRTCQGFWFSEKALIFMHFHAFSFSGSRMGPALTDRTESNRNQQKSPQTWVRGARNNGGKRAAFLVWHFYHVTCVRTIDFVRFRWWNVRFFVRTNSTVNCPENLHVAPPWCPKSIPSRPSWRF